MSHAQSIRSLIPLVIGLAVGGVGVTMFRESLPGAEGSQEERADKLELELKQARNRIAALEATDSPKRARPGRTLADHARGIAEDIREGRPVSPDDIFRASKPLLRDFAPLFDRVRLRQQQRMIDSLTGELARKYDLTPHNLESLKKWFEWKSNEEAKHWTDLIARDDTGLEDMIRASRDVRLDEGLDTYMEGVLSGDKLAAFKTERLVERTERVQQEADMKVQRLDSIVGLDAAQRDQVFTVIARSSRDYDPGMGVEGLPGDVAALPGESRQEAMLSVLRPDQREAYEAARKLRREEAAKDLEAVGLTLPPGWDLLDDEGGPP